MYIAQAYKFKHDVWRYVVGTIIIFLIGWQLIGTIPLTIVSFLEAGSLPEFLSASESSFASLFPAKSNLYLLLILLTFIGGFIALIFVIKYIHKQTLTQLTTSRKKIDWGRFFFGFGLIATLSIVTTVLDFYSNPENYVVQFELIPFLIMLVIVVTLIPIQTSFEEYFCPNEIEIALNMENLFKIVKGIDSNDTLKLYVLKDKPNSFATISPSKMASILCPIPSTKT